MCRIIVAVAQNRGVPTKVLRSAVLWLLHTKRRMHSKWNGRRRWLNVAALLGRNADRRRRFCRAVRGPRRGADCTCTWRPRRSVGAATGTAEVTAGVRQCAVWQIPCADAKRRIAVWQCRCRLAMRICALLFGICFSNTASAPQARQHEHSKNQNDKRAKDDYPYPRLNPARSC